MAIKIEGQEVEIEEDIQTVSTDYDIVGDMLIAKKKLDKTISSKIFNYEDGISIYLKFDDSGVNQFVDLMFAIFKANEEKKILTAPKNADIDLYRVDINHFYVVIDEPSNNSGSFTFVTIKDDHSVAISKLNYTKLVEYEVIDDEFILINCYENLDYDKYIYQMGVYNLSGKLLKMILDKPIPKDSTYEFFIQHKPHGKRSAVAVRTKGTKSHIIGKYDLPEGPSLSEREMLNVNKGVIAGKEDVAENPRDVGLVDMSQLTEIEREMRISSGVGVEKQNNVGVEDDDAIRNEEMSKSETLIDEQPTSEEIRSEFGDEFEETRPKDNIIEEDLEDNDDVVDDSQTDDENVETGAETDVDENIEPETEESAEESAEKIENNEETEKLNSEESDDITENEQTDLDVEDEQNIQQTENVQQEETSEQPDETISEDKETEEVAGAILSETEAETEEPKEMNLTEKIKLADEEAKAAKNARSKSLVEKLQNTKKKKGRKGGTKNDK